MPAWELTVHTLNIFCNCREAVSRESCFWGPLFIYNICLACIVVILCVFVYLICICYTLCVFVVSYVYLLYLICMCYTLMCICCTYVYLLYSYVYLLYCVCIDILTLDAGLLARSQYPEGPATGHLDTGFFLVSLCIQANAEMVPKFPSCYYMLLM